VMQRGLIIIGALMAFTAGGMAQTADLKEQKPRTVSVHGAGHIMTTPDQVRVSVQVNTRGESASQAPRPEIFSAC
jgi:uncharacterized protein YggE